MGKWILMSEQQPEDGAFVLAYGDRCQGMIGGPCISVFHWDRGHWMDANMDYERVYDGAPTHWMPLPEPPEASHG